MPRQARARRKQGANIPANRGLRGRRHLSTGVMVLGHSLVAVASGSGKILQPELRNSSGHSTSHYQRIGFSPMVESVGVLITIAVEPL